MTYIKKKITRTLCLGILVVAGLGLMTSRVQAGAGIDVLRNMSDELCTASADCTSPGDYTYPARVFSYSFDPYGSGSEAFFYANHPAIVAPEEEEELGEGFQLLPALTDISFNLKAFNLPNATTTNLAFWDGSGEVEFELVPTGTALSVYKVVGPTTLSATVDGLGNDVNGFVISKTCEEGGLHEHPNYSLVGDGFAPAQGIYLWSMELSMTGMQTTKPFFVVMETDQSPVAALDAATAWVDSNVDSLTTVPEPSSWLLLGSAVLGLAWFRRKSRA